MTTPNPIEQARIARGRIAARDEAVRAWTALDPDAGIGAPAGPLAGLTLGVKDIVDVAGLVSGCGTPIHADRVASLDAALVAELRALGAIVIGKTATAELAYLSPPATRNPLDLTRSPGGSSSGSAAAVADFHVDAALATQTAGSITRPAAFCGVVGFKPTYGRFSLAGVKTVAPSLDTIGWITRDVATAIRIEQALAGGATRASGGRVGFCRTDAWACADEAMRIAMLDFARELELPEIPSFGAWLDHAHGTIMRFEMRRELAAERLQHRDLLSPILRTFLEGDPVAEAAYRRAIVAIRSVDVDALFGPLDVIATPAAAGEAVPFGSTGDASFNRFATVLGLPTVTLSGARGPLGLPLGIQLLGRPGQDGVVLTTAQQIEQRIALDATAG